MTNVVMVDTDILIDTSRGVPEAIRCLQQIEAQGSLAISVITQMELFIGCRNKAELRAVESFLLRFQIINLNEKISGISVDLLREYRLSHGLLIADALIAATAIFLETPFVSKNRRHYQFVEHLNLLSYPLPLA